eukprot:CAMPEP_0172916550 /NCGR_PEP_ID=MMETSP1075-20121228/196589_1 /TAXON_ID=2916 /ORGANISM="Ceratium fusus, Strain PA161109" /LENGTH=91 /DNA_ID=CAMNT_0013775859 /DNA_START=313 /DNA_END=590 /DNA_ORIENTATION=+
MSWAANSPRQAHLSIRGNPGLGPLQGAQPSALEALMRVAATSMCTDGLHALRRDANLTNNQLQKVRLPLAKNGQRTSVQLQKEEGVVRDPT